MIKAWCDDQRGVEVKPSVFPNEVHVTYNGLLAKSGATEVYCHYGSGSSNYWTNVNTVKMDRTSRGFEKDIKINNSRAFICFKDSANNWDNNSGHNWTIYQ